MDLAQVSRLIAGLRREASLPRRRSKSKKNLFGRFEEFTFRHCGGVAWKIPITSRSDRPLSAQYMNRAIVFSACRPVQRFNHSVSNHALSRASFGPKVRGRAHFMLRLD